MGLPYAFFFSADSDTPMESMIQRAIELGIQGITFTEHLDPDYPATPDGLDFSLDISSYQKKLIESSLYIRIKFICVLESNWGCRCTWEIILTHFSLRHLLILS